MLIKNRDNTNNLSNKEFLEYLKQYKLGNKDAKKRLIENNIGLVIMIVNKRNINNYQLIDDMESVGFIALCEAIDSYDFNRGILFSTYAYRCIDNAILNYLRTYNKIRKEITLHDDINIIEEENGFVEKYALLEVLSCLSERDQEIIKLYYGFYDRCYSQKEIAIIMKISDSGISYIINKNLIKMKKKLLS